MRYSRKSEVADPVRFGQIVEAERNRRNLTRNVVHDRVKLAVMTQYNVENAKGGTPRAKTFAAYDTLFRWDEGVARAVYFGAQPPDDDTEPAAEPAPVAEPEIEPELPPAVKSIAGRLAKLDEDGLKQVEELLNLVDRMRDSKDPESAGG